jgi:putative tricarboxylic transport membrane protein
MKRITIILSAALVTSSTAVLAQAWSPQRNVEIVVGSAPGGSNDKTARQVERILVEKRIVSIPLTVVNKPGGGSTIAFNYVSQHPGDAHFLMVGTTALLSNHIVGSSKLSYQDFTPIASLFNDYVVFVVNAESPIKTGKDLVARLKKDPKSVAIGFATTLGSHNHVAAGLLAKSVGANPRDLKVIAYKGAAEALTNLMGNHIDLVTTAAGNAAPHVAAGRLRVVGVAGPTRFGGALANAPTWKEQGVDLVFGGWRSIMGPKGLSAAQVAYWEGVLAKATQVPEWREDLERNFWADDFVTSAQFRKDLEKDYADMKAVLTDLGMAKQP